MNFCYAAAHCLHEKSHGEPERSRDIELIFGVYDLREHLGTYSASPFEIFIHDDWNPFVENFDADIALVMTEDDVPSTKFIRPVCLWESSNEPIASEGFIAGWGGIFI